MGGNLVSRQTHAPTAPAEGGAGSVGRGRWMACRSAEEGPLWGCAPDSVSRRVVRAGAHKAAFGGVVPGRNAAAPPQACARRERPHRGDTHKAGGDTPTVGSTVASPQAGASEGGRGAPACWGSDPADARGPAGDAPWPAPLSHPHKWGPCSELRRPLLHVPPAPRSGMQRAGPPRAIARLRGRIPKSGAPLRRAPPPRPSGARKGVFPLERASR
jgi:hypothetical protein